MQDLTTQFLNFCRSKPAGEEYQYFSGDCACIQFLEQAGIPRKWTANSPRDTLERRFAEELQAEPATFGALASRIEASLARKGK